MLSIYFYVKKNPFDPTPFLTLQPHPSSWDHKLSKLEIKVPFLRMLSDKWQIILLIDISKKLDPLIVAPPNPRGSWFEQTWI